MNFSRFSQVFFRETANTSRLRKNYAGNAKKLAKNPIPSCNPPPNMV